MKVYDIVKKEAKRIKNKNDYDDTVQQVMMVLIEKNLHNQEPDDKLVNYIKGIIWNISTTIYNQFNYCTDYTDNIIKYDYCTNTEDEPFYIDETKQYKDLMHNIRRYIFNNYYVKGKSTTRFKVWFLKLKGYSYKYISDKLNLTYKSAIEYNYSSNKELKSKFKLI